MQFFPTHISADVVSCNKYLKFRSHTQQFCGSWFRITQYQDKALSLLREWTWKLNFRVKTQKEYRFDLL